MTNLKRQHGFTMIEVLISLVLVTSMVISVTTLLFVASHGNTENADQASANRQIQKQIELLRAASYTSLTNGTYNFSTSDINRVQTAQYVISDFTDGSGTHTELKKITASIKWYEGNVLKTVSVDTYVGQHGINQL